MIYYTHLTSLGLALFASTERGICFLAFADSESELLGELKEEFPESPIIPAIGEFKKQFESWSNALNQFLTGKIQRLDLPLDVQGTPFQKLVWEHLRSIPLGQVQSYTQVAESLGKPKAIRAVGTACAQNKIAIAIPCHRVLRSDGNLSGYRWGLDRKRRLIELERSFLAQDLIDAERSSTPRGDIKKHKTIDRRQLTLIDNR